MAGGRTVVVELLHEGAGAETESKPRGGPRVLGSYWLGACAASKQEIEMGEGVRGEKW